MPGPEQYRLGVGVIVGTRRPWEPSESVARQVYEHAPPTRANARTHRPQGDPPPALRGDLSAVAGPLRSGPHDRRAERIDACDGFVRAAPEYNHGLPRTRKSAIGFPFPAWNDKAVGFECYGTVGETREVERLRLILAELSVPTVGARGILPLAIDFENYAGFRPFPARTAALDAPLDPLVSPGGRSPTRTAPGAREKARPGPGDRRGPCRNLRTVAQGAGRAGVYGLACPSAAWAHDGRARRPWRAASAWSRRYLRKMKTGSPSRARTRPSSVSE